MNVNHDELDLTKHLLFHTQIKLLNLLLQCCLQFALLQHVLEEECLQDECHKDTGREGRQDRGRGQVKNSCKVFNFTLLEVIKSSQILLNDDDDYHDVEQDEEYSC